MSRLAGKRILLVEDEFLIADLTASILEEFSAHVVGPAYDLAQGLKLAESDDLDGAVLDINLGRALRVRHWLRRPRRLCQFRADDRKATRRSETS
jgi:DNA-binding response OmpR family regulator